MKEKIELNSEAIFLRKKLGLDINSPVDIFPTVNQIDHLTTVLYPMSQSLSGMCVRIKGTEGLIAINSTLSYGRQRFTASHELYHLFFQKDFDYIVCSKEINTKKSDVERNADMFASFFLAPFDALKLYIADNINKKGSKNPFTIADIVKIEQYFGMSRQATLFRLLNEGYIEPSFVETAKHNVIQSAITLGFDHSLYVPTNTEKQYYTSGSYIKLVNDLMSKGIISQGKYEELFLEAYRQDIVFGPSGESEETYD